MTASFVVNGTSTTIKFEYTALTARVSETVTSAAHYLWNAGYGDHGTEETPILFESLTNLQKAAIVDAYVKRAILDAAKAYRADTVSEIARKASLAEDVLIT